MVRRRRANLREHSQELQLRYGEQGRGLLRCVPRAEFSVWLVLSELPRREVRGSMLLRPRQPEVLPTRLLSARPSPACVLVRRMPSGGRVVELPARPQVED